MKHLYTFILCLLISVTGIAQTPKLSVGPGVYLKAGTDLVNLGNSGSLSNSGNLTGTVKGLRTIASKTILFNGQTATLSTNVVGGQTYWQWQKSADGLTGWSDISSATSSLYTASTSGFYRAKVYAPNTGYQQFTPAQQVLEIPAENFVLQYTFTSAQPNITFNTLTVGNVNYTLTSSINGITTGTFNQATLGTVTLAGARTAGEVVTISIEPANLRQFKATGSAAFLTDVSQWGSAAWTSMFEAFNGCSKLNITATDMPNLSGVTNMSFMFAYCSVLNGPANINTWNTSAATDMSYLFYNAYAFNKNIGSWDVSNVTNMHSAFRFSYAFNQNIGGWNVSKVQDMTAMFYEATAFNQNIGAWNVSKVTGMNSLFYKAAAFNQAIGGWDVSRVTGMQYIFVNASSFNQNLGNWNLNASVTLSNMFDGSGVDCKNYSSTLLGWANNSNTPSGRGLGAVGRTYGTDAVAARNILTSSKGWTITGDAATGTSCIPAPVIASIANQATCDGQTISNIAIALTDSDVNNATLTATDTSAGINPTYTFGGTGANRTLTIASVAGQVGATTVNVIVTNSYGGKDTASFLLELGIKQTTFVEQTGSDNPLGGNIVTGYANPTLVDIDKDGDLDAFIGYTNYPSNTPSGVGFLKNTNGVFTGQTGTSNPFNSITSVSASPDIAFADIDKDNDLDAFLGGFSGTIRYFQNNGSAVFTEQTGANNFFNGVDIGGSSKLTFADVDNDGDLDMWSGERLASKIVYYQNNGSGVFTEQTGNDNPFTGINMFASPCPAFADIDLDGDLDLFVISGNMDVRYFQNNGGMSFSELTGSNRPLSGMGNPNTPDANINFADIDNDGDLDAFGGYRDGTVRYFKNNTAYVACNAKPVFNPTSLANDTLCLSSSDVALTNRTLTVSDPDGSIASTTVSSSNTALITVTNTGTTNSPVLSLTKKANQSGTATIKVVSTDNMGAKDSISFVIKVNQVTATPSQTNILCYGQSTGSASVVVANGTAPYSYTWKNSGNSTVATASSANSLAAGSYTVNVTDKFNCSAAQTVSITQPSAALALTKDSSNVTCFGLSNGSAKVTATGGTGSYGYDWSGSPTGDGTAQVTGLSAGSYSVTVTDANECSTVAYFSLSQPTEIKITTNPSNANVCAGTDTLLGVKTSGTNLTYQWYAKNGSNIVALANGNGYQDTDQDTLIVTGNTANNATLYFVRVSQSGSCYKESSTASVTARVCNISPVITAISDKQICTNGSVTFDVIATDQDFDNVTVTVSSSNTNLLPASGMTINPSAGSYNTPRQLTLTPKTGESGTATVTVIATDARNGKDTVTFTLTVKELPKQVGLSYIAPICENEPAFTLTQGSPAGGVYTIDNEPGTTFNPEVLGVGAHTVSYSAENEFGCQNTASQQVIVKAVTTPTLADFDAVCRNATAYTLTGGQPQGGSYSGTGVNNGKFNPAGLSGSVTITYAYTNPSHCTGKAEKSITVLDAPAAEFKDLSVCKNAPVFDLPVSENLNETITYSGDGITDNAFNAAVAGTGDHTITANVSSHESCSATGTFTITVKALPTVSFTTDQEICNNAGAVTLFGSPVGGTLIGEGIENDKFNPANLTPGVYTLQYAFQADNGCKDTATTEITVLESPSVTISAPQTSFCEGNSILLSAGEFVKYQWIFEGQEIVDETDAEYSASLAGAYQVKVTNDNQCTGTSAAVNLSQNEIRKPVIEYTGVPNFCSQSTLELSTQEYTTYQWYKNGSAVQYATTAFYSITGSGNYFVKVTDGNCSSSSDVLTVTGSSPVGISANGNPELCEGSSLTLTASSAVHYTWMKDGNGINGANQQSFVATESGYYSVKVTDSYGCSLTSTAIEVTTKQRPAVSTVSLGETSFCPGKSSTLSTTDTYKTYRWKKDGIPIVGASFQSYIATETGNYTVMVSDNGGCYNTSEAISITLFKAADPKLNPAGTHYICQGQGLEVVAAAGMQSYQWTQANQPVTGATGNSINITETGSYRVILETTDGCKGLSDAVIVFVKSSPGAPTIDFTDSLLTASDAPNYQWYQNGILLQGETAKTLKIASNGMYTVEVLGANGCSASTSYEVNALKLEEIQPVKFALYPNPISSSFTIDSALEGSYKLYDSNGKLVLEGTIKSGQNVINAEEIAGGLYQLRVFANGKPATSIKVVK